MHSNRNNTQNLKLYQEIRFLQTENAKLKDELSDQKDLLNMNKIEIDVLSKQSKGDKKLIDVIYNYRQQLQSAQKKTEIVNEKLRVLQSEKLVIEQLNQELQTEQKSIEDLHKSRVEELSKNIRQLEKKVELYEKNHKNYDVVTGFVERNRDLYTPLDQTIEFKKKQDEWLMQIQHLKEEMEAHKHNEDNLLLANGVLRNKVVTLQAKLAMPNKNLGEILDKSLKRLMLYFIETQKKMLTGEDSDSEEDDYELIAPELLSLFPEKCTNSHSDYKVPPLDILKVRTHQIKGNDKIKDELNRRNHLTPSERIERLEIELEFTRRSLTKNMMQLKSERDRRKLLERICEELEERNGLLAKSNQLYQAKVEKLKRQYSANRDKIMSSGKIELFEEDNPLEDSFARKDSVHVHNHQRTRELEVNKYLESVETPFEFKLHLQLLAKDLEKNKKLKEIKQKPQKARDNNATEESHRSKLKRSTSNPFLYFNERRDQIMEIKPERQILMSSTTGNDREMQRLQQTEMLPSKMASRGFTEEDLQGLDDQ